ncbi:MAG TPA: bifunctional glycosyltransferase family 2/GtrA family protein [Anaeromyxobacter sp.]|nr:bifunctional glycosyltransferase family 2/GtrA family protein [Anaeromyxobacter sp.]
MARVCIAIPAFNPDGALAAVVRALRGAGFDSLVVVDDGSDTSSRQVFAEIEGTCTVLRHAVNLGKGRALKTALNACLVAFPDAAGVVTADADGQHAPEDIARVAQELSRGRSALVLGSRTFDARVPLRSRVGNVLTRWMFRLLVGRTACDTQTGLRGIPRAAVPELLRVPGERYEYEMNVLLATKALSLAIVEIPIRTIYVDGNRSSHFNPFLDSMRIWFQLLRFGMSSALTALVDYLVFWIVLRGSGVLVALVTARIVASVANFAMNRQLVFRARGRIVPALLKYWTLVAVFGTVAYFSITVLQQRTGMNVLAAKALVEGLLFLASFSVQRDFIFSTAADPAGEAG